MTQEVCSSLTSCRVSSDIHSQCLSRWRKKSVHHIRYRVSCDIHSNVFVDDVKVVTSGIEFILQQCLCRWLQKFLHHILYRISCGIHSSVFVDDQVCSSHPVYSFLWHSLQCLCRWRKKFVRHILCRVSRNIHSSIFVDDSRSLFVTSSVEFRVTSTAASLSITQEICSSHPELFLRAREERLPPYWFSTLPVRSKFFTYSEM